MSCEHNSIQWEVTDIEQMTSEEFSLPGVCRDCGQSVAAKLSISEVSEMNV